MDEITPIDEFVFAFYHWSKTIGDPYIITLLLMRHAGASPEHCAHPLALREYLHNLVEKSRISRGVLIGGLIKIIDMEFTYHAEMYQSQQDQKKFAADLAERLANDPEYFERLSKELEEAGFKAPRFENMRRISEDTRKSLDNVDDNQGERNMMLLVWRDLAEFLWVGIEQDLRKSPH